MKKQLFFLVSFAIALAHTVSAQVREMEKSMALGSHNALVIEIPQADDKLVARVWNNYLKEFYKAKTKQLKSGGEILAEGVSIPALNPGGAVDLYVLPEKNGSDVVFSMWVKLPQGFLNSREYNDPYKDAESMLRRFAVEVNKEKVRMDLANQEKELGNMEKELRRLQSDNARYHKEIEDAQARIKKAEENIVKNEADQKAVEEKISSQKKTVETVRKRLEQM